MARSLAKDWSEMDDMNQIKKARASVAEPPPWQNGWEVFKAIWPRLMYISIVGIAIPQYLGFWNSALSAQNLVQKLQSPDGLSLLETLEKVQDFSLSSILEMLLTGILAIWAFLSWTLLAYRQMSGLSCSSFASLKAGLRLTLRKGLPTLLLFTFLVITLGMITALLANLSVVTQILFISLFVLSSTIPSLIVIGESSPIQTLKECLSMSYTKGTGITRWSVYFILLTYEMLLLLAINALEWGFESLTHLDMKIGLNRSSWFFVNNVFPFGIIPMLSSAIKLCLMSMFVAIFAVFTTAFLTQLRQKTKGNSKLSIRV